MNRHWGPLWLWGRRRQGWSASMLNMLVLIGGLWILFWFMMCKITTLAKVYVFSRQPFNWPMKYYVVLSFEIRKQASLAITIKNSAKLATCRSVRSQWDCHFRYEVTVGLSLQQWLCIQFFSDHTIQCNVQCVLYSPNSITVVSAIFSWRSSSWPITYLQHPPNVVVWTRPGQTLQVVIVCPHLGCVLSGRVSCMGRGGTTDL